MFRNIWRNTDYQFGVWSSDKGFSTVYSLGIEGERVCSLFFGSFLAEAQLMLKQASVSQIRSGEITRKDGFIAITMCFYPRGLRKELRDKYFRDLAPDRELFKDFKENQNKFGHEEAFRRSHYLRRFKLSEKGLSELKELAEMSRQKIVYLTCQCEIGERCHREILMLLAHEMFGAKISKIFHGYSHAKIFSHTLRKTG